MKIRKYGENFRKSGKYENLVKTSGRQETYQLKKKVELFTSLVTFCVLNNTFKNGIQVCFSLFSLTLGILSLLINQSCSKTVFHGNFALTYFRMQINLIRLMRERSMRCLILLLFIHTDVELNNPHIITEYISYYLHIYIIDIKESYLTHQSHSINKNTSCAQLKTYL